MDQPGVVRLAFLYVGSGSKGTKLALKAFDAWIEGAKSRKGGYVLDIQHDRQSSSFDSEFFKISDSIEMMDTVGFFRE